jgi:hypothetical protein
MRSACSVLVGMPVEGPARCTLSTTSGTSAIEANPIASVFNARPGPEEAVSALTPAYDAPMAMQMEASSSSGCTMTPPNFGSSRASHSITSDCGVIG